MAAPAIGCAPSQVGPVRSSHTKFRSFVDSKPDRNLHFFNSEKRVGKAAGTPTLRVTKRQQLNLTGTVARSSPDVVKEEIRRCYELVQRLGRGALYIGSSRVAANHSHYLQAMELARETAKLLDCTTWTGAGPGLMDAAIKGALEAKKPVGGFKIAKESGQWTSSNFHPYLPSETYVTCKFFSARKHGLVDAVVRNKPDERTAIVVLPGGIGTLDEIFEILALIQLERIGSKFPIPFLLVNYNSYYSKLLDFMDGCEKWGTLAAGEVEHIWKVCNGNLEVLDYLSDFYSIPASKRNYQIQHQHKEQYLTDSNSTS